MKISVLTVTYNSAATLAHTIDSFLAQTHADKEMVVVDGASTDGTLDVVARYGGHPIRVVSEPDRGMYDALNKGLKLFEGDAVGVLNSDDRYHDETALARIARGLEEAEAVHGHLDFVEDHEGSRIVRRWRGEERPRSGFRGGWMPAHPTFYVRRSLAERVGEFDLSLKTASDYDWMLRAVEGCGATPALVDHVLIDMMQGGRSTSGLRSHLHHNLEALRARQRHLGAGALDYALVAKPARKIGQFLLRGRS